MYTYVQTIDNPHMAFHVMMEYLNRWVLNGVLYDRMILTTYNILSYEVLSIFVFIINYEIWIFKQFNLSTTIYFVEKLLILHAMKSLFLAALPLQIKQVVPLFFTCRLRTTRMTASRWIYPKT